jgi:two-component system, cell cycle sensor histidine kinase and response regulator CckA
MRIRILADKIFTGATNKMHFASHACEPSHRSPEESDMQDEDKSKQQLIIELKALRQRVAESEKDKTERKLAEEALRESEQRLSQIIDFLPDATFAIDLNGKVIAWNRAIEEMTGVKAEQILGRGDYEYALPFYGIRRPVLVDLVFTSDEEIKNKYHFVKKEGDVLLAEADGPVKGKESRALWGKARPLYDIDGNIVGAIEAIRDITERKRSENALHESEERYRQVVQNATEAIVVAQDGKLKFVNRVACEITGYPEEELLSHPFLDFIHREDRSMVMDRHLRRLRGETLADRYPFRLVGKDGGASWVEIGAAMIEWEGRTATLNLLTDITERKLAEEALRESEELYRTLVSLSPDAILVADVNGVLTFTSPKARQMFGLSPDDEVLGRSLLCWIVPEDHGWANANIHRLLTEGPLKATEYTMIKKDGTRFIGEVNAAVIHSPDGSPMRMIAIIRDVTERKRAEEALKESEERFSRFFRSTPVGTSITRLSDGQFVDINDAFLDLSGYTREEVIGQNSLKQGWWANPGDREKVIEILQEHGRIRDFETQLVSKFGDIIDVLGSAEVIEMADEKYMLSLAYDVTERKRGEKERKKLEEQLFQAQKMESVGRLAGGVAHDFNNMLGVIIGRAELALNTEVSADQLQHNLKEILKAGLRSADLTRQLLAFARKQTAVPKVLDLNSTISGMLMMLRRLIGEDIDLLWGPELDLWEVKIDPSQVDQILANLVVNARDAISGVGAITMRTENVAIDDFNSAETPGFIPGQYVLLTVSNTGAGMSKEVRENIYEPFFTTKEVGKGTGLGLSTVYGIVKQNDGFIYVASEPGKGATFKIYLPRFVDETTQVSSDEAAGKHPTGTETILLVEDDEAILNLGKMILENLGYTVLAAQTPVDAIRIAEEYPGDLHMLTTDVVMPEMNGRELAEQLNAIRPNLKCLYMSGYTADVIAHRGILDEGLNFIQKPFGSDDLAARVREVLDHLE